VALKPFSPNNRRPARTSAARVWATCSARKDGLAEAFDASDITPVY